MIHIATVHWRADHWIDVQLGYLERNTNEPFRMYAWLDEHMVDEHAEKFHYWTDIKIRAHEIKLTLLGDVMSVNAADDDILLFIDGDAFPVQPIMPFLHESLAEYPLVAIRRSENNGDEQPHPCFCATTAGFWRSLPGDWRRGATWLNPQGKEVTDVGGNLNQLLKDRGIDWLPMLRSNVINPHPLNYGLYADLVYHHGGGFRPTAGGRVVMSAVEERLQGSLRMKVAERIPRRGRLGKLRKRIHPLVRERSAIAERLAIINQQVYELLVEDEDFWRQLIEPERGGLLTEVRAPTDVG